MQKENIKAASIKPKVTTPAKPTNKAENKTSKKEEKK